LRILLIDDHSVFREALGSLLVQRDPSLEIVGERGKLVLENNKITFTRNEASMLEFSKTSKIGFARPEVWNVEVPYDTAAGPQHAVSSRNFLSVIASNSQLNQLLTDFHGCAYVMAGALLRAGRLPQR